ncbi:MAG TPA: beta-glucosidase BglX [Bacteroidales bacterium]|nr:beta-glucosidase BglX [Bacteroidales bacterium]
MNTYKILIIAFSVMTIACSHHPNTIDEKVDNLLSQMTLDEKIGQLVQYNGFWDATGPIPQESNTKKKYEDVKQGLVGSVLNVYGTAQVRKLQEIAVTQSRLGIPLIFGMDVIHGYKTAFPVPIAEAACWNMQTIEQAARISAIEASAAGINWTFAPMLDVSRDPRWGRVMEGAGEDPYLTAQVGIAKIKGFQGTDLSHEQSIAACAKHFAGYGFPIAGRDYNTVDVSMVTLYNDILPPFKAAVYNNVATVMNAFNVLNGVPCTGNTMLVRNILKHTWNFKGFVVSDWGSIMELATHGYARDRAHAAQIAIEAGCDMDMESYAYRNDLKPLVENGTIPESLIDDAVRRILRIKFELGLFDNPYKYCDSVREKTILHATDFSKEALQSALEAIVLLKNDNSLLPLSKNQKHIAVIGALANDKDSPIGNWRAQALPSSAVSVLEGLAKYTSNITYVQGAVLNTNPAGFTHKVSINETDKSGFAEAIAVAKKSEVVVMVLGENCFQSGEARSRSDIGLPGVQQELLEAVYAVNKNIVLILMNGRPLTIPWAGAHVPAILETWQLGSQSGNAIAQVLFGDFNPQGKLPMSFPRSVGQIPLYYNHLNTGRPAGFNRVFWSHYTDIENTPLYSFGHGLSYTTFAYSNLEITPKKNGEYTITACITNTGTRVGTETPQLYIRDIVASVVRPVKELKGFTKVTLKPNESKTIEFVLTDAELGFYTETGAFTVEPGEFEIMIGSGSDAILLRSILVLK